MSIFKGAGVAIVTPMKNNEEVNYDRLEQILGILSIYQKLKRVIGQRKKGEQIC